jgi:phage FluMu protein Com
MPDSDPQTIYKDIEGRSQWRCQHCNKVYLESGGTRIISSHLRIFHRITQQSAREEQRSRVHGSIQQAFANARQSNGFKRRRAIFDYGMEEEEDHKPQGK